VWRASAASAIVSLSVSRADAFAVLRNPYVRSFALGRISSTMGMQILTTAVGWELYLRTNDAWALAFVGLVQLLPVLLFMVPAGNAADRYPRRNMSMLANGLLVVAALGLALVSWLHAPIWVVYSLLFLVGTSRAFGFPSTNTLLPQLVEPHEYVNANLWTSSAFELASITGPAVGGAIIAATGQVFWAYLVAAFGVLLFVLLLGRFPAIHPPAPTAKRSAAETYAGFIYIRRVPVFLAAITLDLFAVLLGGAVALLPIFAKDILHAGPVGLGLLRASPSVGALSMAFVTTRLRPWGRPGRALLIVVAGFGAATVGFGLSKSLPLSMAFLFLTGACDQVSVVIRQTLEQILTPDRLRGRVSSVNAVFVSFSNELGAFESGSTAALFGAVPSVVLGGLGTILVVLIVARVWPMLGKLGPLASLRPPE
jgi:MFS family permease